MHPQLCIGFAASAGISIEERPLTPMLQCLLLKIHTARRIFVPMELSKDYLLSQLYKINPTEDSLKSLALYIRTFKNEHALIVEGIAYVHAKSSLHHRLLLFYLVNEILQTERASAGQPLRQGLKAFLLQHFIADLNSCMAESVISKKFAALQYIWKTRNIIDFGKPGNP